MVFPSILSVWLATEGDQGPLTRLSLSEEIEKIKCVCLVWVGEQWEGSDSLLMSRVIIFALVAHFHHIFGYY